MKNIAKMAGLLGILLSSSILSSSIQAAGLADVVDCPGVGQPRSLVAAPGTFEALAFDARGRLVVSNWLGNRVHVLDSPDAGLRTLMHSVWRPGGLVLQDDGSMLVGSGIDTLALLAPASGFSRLFQFDVDSGERSVYAQGLSMGNGLTQASDGTVFASNDLAPALDRIDPDGTVHRGWYRASPSNGLALSADESILYANVSLGRTRILAIDTDSAVATTYFAPPAGLEWVFLDDLDVDAKGRLYSAVYFGGHVWRVDSDGSFCALAKGLILPAGITLGQAGSGFSETSVYVSTHLGGVFEIPNAVPVD